jgi:hypothetical protein
MSSISSIGFGSTAVQNALSGINRGMANLSQDAQIIAQPGGPMGQGSIANGDSVTDALVDAQTQKLDVEASVKALRIADQTLGSLLDIKA